jgi:Zn ribbon nucleic-acid-binding protein
MTKKITDPLKKEWDAKKGIVDRVCPVCQETFRAEHWRQTNCKKELCVKYAFRFSHVRASYKRWSEVVEEVKKAGLKPSFDFTCK